MTLLAFLQYLYFILYSRYCVPLNVDAREKFRIRSKQLETSRNTNRNPVKCNTPPYNRNVAPTTFSISQERQAVIRF